MGAAQRGRVRGRGVGPSLKWAVAQVQRTKAEAKTGGQFNDEPPTPPAAGPSTAQSMKPNHASRKSRLTGY